jgi:hypothetical protein
MNLPIMFEITVDIIFWSIFLFKIVLELYTHTIGFNKLCVGYVSFPFGVFIFVVDFF